GEPLTYQPILMALRAALPTFQTMALSRLQIAALIPVLPELKTLYPNLHPLQSGSGEEEARKRLFNALVYCFMALASRAPLLLLLDDMQWAATATWSFVEYLAARVKKQPILVLVTYRERGLLGNIAAQQSMRRLYQHPLIRQLGLGRLSKEASLRMIGIRAPEWKAMPGLGAILYERSGGNPFVLDQFIGYLQHAAHRARGEAESVLLLATTLSPDMSAIILERLGWMSPDGQAVAGVAAVIGIAFDIELLCEVGGWSESMIHPWLEELKEQHFIRAAGVGGSYDYVFTHDLIQQVIIAGLPDLRQREHHRRISELMVRIYDADHPMIKATLARHLEQAGEDELAAAAYLNAAEQAFNMHADEESCGLASRGLRLTTAPQLEFTLLAQREESLNRRGQTMEQQRDLARLDALAARSGIPDARQQVLYRHIRLAARLGDRDLEGDAITRLKAIADPIGFPRWHAVALRQAGRYHAAAGEWDLAQSALKAALTIFQDLDDKGEQIECLCRLTDIFSLQNRITEMNEYLNQSQAFLTDTHDSSMIIRILQATYAAHFAQQDYATCVRISREILNIAQEIGDTSLEATSHLYLGGDLMLTSPEQSLKHFSEALAVYSTQSHRMGQASVLTNMGHLSIILGQAAPAFDYFNRAADLFTAIQDWHGQLNSLCGLGQSLWLLGSNEAARDTALKAVEQARTLHVQSNEAYALIILGSAERELGNLSIAVAHHEAAVQLRRTLNQPPALADDLGELVTTYLRSGQPAAALVLAEELVGLYNDHAANMYTPHHTLWAAVQTYHATGKATDAQALLREAWSIFQERLATITDPQSRMSFANHPRSQEIIKALGQTGI
ncbi:MAG TPA: AAA family ATPase, partial [Herpetosiphonaceae bacterium]|nr:AAA family ATPase [Herpetosiphonaceae bacterium]